MRTTSSTSDSRFAPISPAARATPCPGCGSERVEDFFQLERLPVHVGVLYDSADAARRAPMGRLTLAYCRGCGLAFNRSFEPEKLIFSPGYEVQLVHSAVFRAFLETVADRLIARYGLRDKDLIDIGCGAGHFLRLLCEHGPNRGLGIDPTLRQPGDVPLAVGELHLVRGLFGELRLDREFDFASCQSVLEDIPDPVRFIAQVRRLVERRQGCVYLEVFNAFRAFEAGETWSLCYEQCLYYSLQSFRNVVRRAGLRILESGGCYVENQYLYVEAKAEATPAPPDSTDAAELPAAIWQFSQLHAQKLADWTERIARFRQQGKQVVVWGSGAKGICFLNTVGATDVFRTVVDINPDRQGRFMPGSAQPIVAPDWLAHHRPDVIVLTNPLYEDEIRTTVASMGLSCDFVVI